MSGSVLTFIESNGWVTVIIRFVVLLVLTWVVARVASRLIGRFTERDETPLASSSIFVTIAKVAIWAIGIGTILEYCFGINATGIVAALGVGGIAISLGFQDTFSNLIAGLQVSHGKLVAPDDWVEVLGVFGRVTDVGWRHTTICDENGAIHYIPNSLINKNALTRFEDGRWVYLTFPIDIASDIEGLEEQVAAEVETGCADIIAPDSKPVAVLKAGEAGGILVTTGIRIVNGSLTTGRTRDRLTKACRRFIADTTV